MKKKLVAFAVTAAMLVTSAVPAFALTQWGSTSVEGNVVMVDGGDAVPSSEVAHTFTGNETTTFETVVDFNYDLGDSGKLNFTLNYVDTAGVNREVVLHAVDQQTSGYALYFDGEDVGATADTFTGLDGVCTLEWTANKTGVQVRVVEHASGDDYVATTQSADRNYIDVAFAQEAISLTNIKAQTTGEEIAIYKAYPEQLLSVEVSKVDEDGKYTIPVDQPSYGDKLCITALNLSSDTVIDGLENINRYIGKAGSGVQWYRDGEPISGANTYYYEVGDADRGSRITVKVTLNPDCGIFKEFTWGTGADRIAEFDRYAGANRYETAMEIADAFRASVLSGAKFHAVIVANGDGYADALSATALAKKVKAPILLVNANTEDTVAEYIFDNIASDGTVYFVGGENVVSKNFADKFFKYHKVRYAGDDRYDTNMMILRAVGIEGKHVQICSASGYADALSASATGKPVLLVGDQLTAVQKNFLKANVGTTTDFTVIGGTAVVNDSLKDFVAAHYDKDNKVDRLYGINRYETNEKVVERFYSSGSAPAKYSQIQEVVIASGNGFADALTGAALAANLSDTTLDTPVLLVNDTNYDRAATILDSAALNHGVHVMVVGGEMSVSNELVQKIEMSVSNELVQKIA